METKPSTLMNTLDTFSKRILVVAVSISLVLLSLSAFLLTIQRVQATPEPNQFPNLVVPSRIGLGIDVRQQVGYVGMVGPDGSVTLFKMALPQ